MLASTAIAQDDLFSDRKTSSSKTTLSGVSTGLPAGTIVLLITSTGSDDPIAAALQRSFRFGSNEGLYPFNTSVIVDNSSYETMMTASSLMKQDSVFMIVFVADEGTAIALSLLSKESKVPLLKLSGDVRSLSNFSPYLTEFLPSQQAQAQALGEFAVKEHKYESALSLVSMDEKGRALSEGFKSGCLSGKVITDTTLFYPPETESVRKELEDMFSSQARLSHGKNPLKGSLSAEERAEFFGDAQGGEVLVSAENADTLQTDSSTMKEAFFFGLSAEKVDDYSQQLKELPEFTDLYGNSSWVDLNALEKNKALTEGMYIAVPLLPETTEPDSILANYESQYEIHAGAWELLGLDAADFVGKIMSSKPKSRNDLQKIMRDSRFNGRAVQVNFINQENKAAHILQYSSGELKVIR